MREFQPDILVKDRNVMIINKVSVVDGLDEMVVLCDGSERHLNTLARGVGPDFEKIHSYVTKRTLEALETMRSFTNALSKDPILQEANKLVDTMGTEFHKLFAYQELYDDAGTQLTGKAWLAGLDRARTILGSQSSIAQRFEESKRIGVQSSWRAHGDAFKHASSLFPVPLHFRSTQQVTFGPNILGGETVRPGSKDIPTKLKLGMRDYAEGTSWASPKSEDEGSLSQVCGVGDFAPPEMGISLEISLEHCRGQLKGSDETRHSWSFVFRSIVKSQEVKVPAMASGASDFWEAMEDEEGEGGISVRGDAVDEANDSIAWQLARYIMLNTNVLKCSDPKLDTDDMSATANCVSGRIQDALNGDLSAEVRKISALLVDTVLPKSIFGAVEEDGAKLAAAEADPANAAEAARAAVPTAPPNLLAASTTAEPCATTTTTPVPPVTIKIMTVVTTTLNFERVGDREAWAKSFGVTYQTLKSSDPDVGVPTALGDNMASGSYSNLYDLSDVFNALFEETNMPTNFYDCCTQCLATAGATFCQAVDQAPRCAGEGAPLGECQGGAKAVMMTQCSIFTAVPAGGFNDVATEAEYRGRCQPALVT